jgi:broad specificity phosphatase PhoE
MLASPFRRALNTAGPVVEKTGLSIEVNEDLREIDFGQWEGLSFQEIEKKDPDMVAEWARGEMDFRFPGGESLSTFEERVRRAGEQLATLPEERIFVVTHGGVIRFLLCHFLKLPPRSHFMFEIDRGSITRIHLHEGHAVLSGLNDCCHLEDI